MKPESTPDSTLPAFFLPGWGFGQGPLQQPLAGTGWQLLDLPGAQGESVPAHFDAARDALLAQLPPASHLGGWSLGGMLALACAIAAPERIRSLVLVGTTPSFVQRPGWELGRPPLELQAFRAKVAEQGAAILPRFTGSFCRGDSSPEVASHLLSHASAMPQAALEAGLDWLAEADLRDQLACVKCPVSIIHGTNDPLMPVAIAHWLTAQLAQAQLHLLPGKAHAPFAPDPTLFLQGLPRP